MMKNGFSYTNTILRPYKNRPDIINIADGEGGKPIQLIVVHPGARSPIKTIYIFEETTVAQFLDLLDQDRDYNYIFEKEIINEIPGYYILSTLGVQHGSIIKKTGRQNFDDDESDPDWEDNPNLHWG